jgi:hypothetical protein
MPYPVVHKHISKQGPGAGHQFAKIRRKYKPAVNITVKILVKGFFIGAGKIINDENKFENAEYYRQDRQEHYQGIAALAQQNFLIISILHYHLEILYEFTKRLSHAPLDQRQ